MPKRISKSARPSDINQAAFQMIHRSTQSEASENLPPVSDAVSRVMAAMGRRGGKIGGKRRLQTMTAEERRKVALKAAKTRWAKHTPE
jgi:hypothetical protein